MSREAHGTFHFITTVKILKYNMKVTMFLEFNQIMQKFRSVSKRTTLQVWYE